MGTTIKLENNIIESAKMIACKINDKETRLRTYALNIAAGAVAQCFDEMGLDPDTKLSLYKISSFARNFELADVYVNGFRFDVRVSFDGKIFTIPKVHEKYDAIPLAYIVVKLDKDLNEADILGFVVPKAIELEKTSNPYYTVGTDILAPIEDIKDLIETTILNIHPYSIHDHEKIKELATSFIDEEISESEKVFFIKHVIACPVCRETYCDINDFDIIVSQLKNYHELLNDSTLSVLSGNKKEVDEAAMANMSFVENAQEESNDAGVDDLTALGALVSDDENEEELIADDEQEEELIAGGDEFLSDVNVEENIQDVENPQLLSADENNTETETVDILSLADESEIVEEAPVQTQEETIVLQQEEAPMLHEEEELHELGEDLLLAEEHHEELLIHDHDDMQLLHDEPEHIEDIVVPENDLSGKEVLPIEETPSLELENLEVLDEVVDELPVVEEITDTNIEQPAYVSQQPVELKDDEESEGLTEQIIENVEQPQQNEPEQFFAETEEVLSEGQEPSLESTVNDTEIVNDETQEQAAEDSQNAEIQSLLDDDLLALLSGDDEPVNSEDNETVAVEDFVENEFVEENTQKFVPAQEQQVGDGTINTLFEDNVTPADGEEKPFELAQEPISEEAVKKTKRLAVMIGLLAVLAAAAGGNYFINQSKSSSDIDTSVGDQMFDMDEQATASNTQDAALSPDINRAMTNSFSDKPTAITITKLSWQVSEKLAADTSVKEYLQTAGKNIQMNLQNDLATSADINFNNTVKVSFEIAPDNTMKGIQVLESSGSDKIDNLITKSIQNTLKYISVPKLKDYKSDYFLTLIINF